MSRASASRSKVSRVGLCTWFSMNVIVCRARPAFRDNAFNEKPCRSRSSFKRSATWEPTTLINSLFGTVNQYRKRMLTGYARLLAWVCNSELQGMLNKVKISLVEGDAPPAEMVEFLLPLVAHGASIRAGYRVFRKTKRTEPRAARNDKISRGNEVMSRFRSASDGKQFLHLDLQSIRQENKFFIRHATQLGFYFRDCVFANVPTNPRATRRQHSLGPALAIANFSDNGTDDILRNRFAHSFALTVCDRAVVFLPISEGTDARRMGNDKSGGAFTAGTRL